MAKAVLDDGFLIVSVRYVFKKEDGSFYYQRRVPKGLERHYGGKALIRKSLKTKSPHIAAREARKLAAEQDTLWKHLRTPEAKDLGLTTKEAGVAAAALLKTLDVEPGDGLKEFYSDYDPLDGHLATKYGEEYLEARHGEYRREGELERLLSPVENEALRLVYSKPGESRKLLSDARDLYLKDHNKGQQTRFRRDTERAVQHVIDAVGDLPLGTYTREKARSVVEVLKATGNKTATVRRRLRTINAVINHGIREFDLRDLRNQFEALQIQGEGDDASTREPFTLEELKAIAKACRKIDDDIRHIIAIQLDTGARAGEVVGLRAEDLFLDHEVPHVWFRPNVALGRTLKTLNSTRKVPLVGLALWGAQRALAAVPKGSGWLFPRYATDGEIKTTYASNTINKWLKSTSGTKKTSHCFRHSMRDRLREAKASEDIQNEIGGWGRKTIGQSYGEGYALKMKREFLSKVVFD